MQTAINIGKNQAHITISVNGLTCTVTMQEAQELLNKAIAYPSAPIEATQLKRQICIEDIRNLSLLQSVVREIIDRISIFGLYHLVSVRHISTISSWMNAEKEMVYGPIPFYLEQIIFIYNELIAKDEEFHNDIVANISGEIYSTCTTSYYPPSKEFKYMPWSFKTGKFSNKYQELYKTKFKSHLQLVKSNGQ